MLLGFAALGLDTGWQRVAMTQLHNAADAGAHAGAMELDGTPAGIVAARERALALTEANSVLGQPVTLDATDQGDVQIGRFDVYLENGCQQEDGCWTLMGGVPSVQNDYDGSDATTAEQVVAAEANAVRVQAGQAVPPIFGSAVFGVQSLPATNFAIARLPIRDGEPCTFPLAVPECSITEFMGSAPCNKLLRWRFSNSNVDTAAWATPVDQNGADVMREMIAVADGACVSRLGNDDIGDGEADIDLNNGALASVTDIIVAQLAGDEVNVGVDLDGDGANDIVNYGDILPAGWDDKWGDCPGTVAEACDTAVQGICKCTGQADCTNYSTQAGCTGGGGTWTTTCPDHGPECPGDGIDNDGDGQIDEDDIMLRRQAVTVDPSGSMGCDGTNGNLDTANQSWNYSADMDATGFVSVVIYDAVSTANDKYVDVFITCNDQGGEPYDEDEDGNADAVHTQDDRYIEDPEGHDVAIVE